MVESRVVKEWQDQARKEDRREMLIEILQNKFGNLPADLSSQLHSIDDAAKLRQLALKASHLNSLDEFQKHLGNGN
jgi:hypothetical protein